ncbi:hypothetical protein [Paractinoplanes hotanensis]|uniref:hypothetical protein n=1 Tax=Paractinoplanes hotanensis TaxID=2906497 RepID=UPI003F6921BA
MCPACLKSSSRVHSRYRLTVTDTPVAGPCVRIFLRVRRFVSENPESSRIAVTTAVLPSVYALRSTGLRSANPRFTAS